MPSMPDTKNTRSRLGYDQEEAYFFERNREIIEKKRTVKPDLVLLPGGRKEDSRLAAPPGRNVTKNAA